MTEGAVTMLAHGAMVAIILFVLMRFALKQPHAVAMNRSVVAGLLVATYMILFGHSFPPAGLRPAFRF